MKLTRYFASPAGVAGGVLWSGVEVGVEVGVACTGMEAGAEAGATC